MGQSFDVFKGQFIEMNLDLSSGDPAVDENEETTLRWRRNLEVSKITISTSCLGQQFTLTAEAFNLKVIGPGLPGTAMPPVTLTDGMIAADLIRNIPISVQGNGDVRLHAEATFSDGTGEDVHLVTYTKLAQ
jgi:hypothetical protein